MGALMNDRNLTADLNDRLSFAGIGEEQRRLLAEIRPIVRESVGGALDTFYAKAKVHPHTSKFFNNDAHIAHAKGRQVTHWDNIASGNYDSSYVEAVSAIGRTHARLGLEPRWYIGGYTMILDGIVRAVVQHHLKGFFYEKKAKVVADQVAVVVKAALVDMDYAITVYLDSLEARRKEAEAVSEKTKAEQDAAMLALDAALKELASGNLASELWQDLAEDFAGLKNNYNSSVGKLGAAMQDISQSVAQVKAEADGISSAADNMAKRTEQQASALEQTAAALEEITTLSSESAKRTREVQEIVKTSATETVRSGEVVESAIAAMDDIEQSSQKMTQIIGAIDEIAFQTNLLALNAGVEAAARRAGQGLCRRCAGSARTGAAFGRSRQADQGTDRPVIGGCAARRRPRQPHRRGASRHRIARCGDRRAHQLHRPVGAGTGSRHRADQFGRSQHGSHHPAECRVDGRDQRLHPEPCRHQRSIGNLDCPLPHQHHPSGEHGTPAPARLIWPATAYPLMCSPVA